MTSPAFLSTLRNQRMLCIPSENAKNSLNGAPAEQAIPRIHNASAGRSSQDPESLDHRSSDVYFSAFQLLGESARYGIYTRDAPISVFFKDQVPILFLKYMPIPITDTYMSCYSFFFKLIHTIHAWKLMGKIHIFHLQRYEFTSVFMCISVSFHCLFTCAGQMQCDFSLVQVQFLISYTTIRTEFAPELLNETTLQTGPHICESSLKVSVLVFEHLQEYNHSCKCFISAPIPVSAQR